MVVIGQVNVSPFYSTNALGDMISALQTDRVDVEFVVLQQEIWTCNVEMLKYLLKRYRAQGSSSATNINNVLHS